MRLNYVYYAKQKKETGKTEKYILSSVLYTVRFCNARAEMNTK